MKTSLLSVLSLLIGTSVFAQCVPETGFTGAGAAFLPVQLEPVYACADCGDHERVITVKTFADTTLSVELAPGNPPLDVTVYADFFRLDSIGGLPAGLSYTTDAAYDTTYDPIENPFGYWINEGDTTIGFTPTTGCITISGTAADWTAAIGGGPNNDGIYPLTIYLDARAADFDPSDIGGIVGYNTWLTDMGFLLDAFGDTNFTDNGIRYQGPALEVIESGLGISEQADGNFLLMKNQPNPFSGTTLISFDLKEGAELDFMVHDVLGSTVHAQTVNGTKGRNTINFSANGLASGIYFYSLSDGKSMLTRKMTIE